MKQKEGYRFRWIFVVLLMLLGYMAKSQTGAPRPVDSIANLIRIWYNNGEMDSIYARFSTKMQKAIGRETLQNAYEKQLNPLGNIMGLGFENNTGNIYRYKVTTSSGTLLQMLINLNDSSAIDAFAFQPYQFKPEKSRDNIYSDNAMTSALDSAVQKIALNYMQNRFTPGMSVAILDSAKVYYYNFGIARAATDQHPTKATQYEIGSITKTMVAYVLADAFVSGKLKYNESIYAYLPDSVRDNEALKKITFVQLSNHSSGLPRLPDNLLKDSRNFQDSYAYYTKESLYAYLRKAKLDSEPGSTYSYSNLAVGLLGTLLEDIYNEPLEELLQQKIFSPLKMSNTYVSLTGNEADTTMLASPFNALGKPALYWHFKSLAGAGAVVSSPEDMVKFAAHLLWLKPQGSKKPSITTYLDSISFQKSPYVSLGWHFNKASGENQIMDHSGGTAGFRTQISLCKEKKLAVFVAINAAEDPGATLVGQQIVQYLIQAKNNN